MHGSPRFCMRQRATHNALQKYPPGSGRRIAQPAAPYGGALFLGDTTHLTCRLDSGSPFFDEDAGPPLPASPPNGIGIGQLFASSECVGEGEPRRSEGEEERPSCPGIEIAADMAAGSGFSPQGAKSSRWALRASAELLSPQRAALREATERPDEADWAGCRAACPAAHPPLSAGVGGLIRFNLPATRFCNTGVGNSSGVRLYSSVSPGNSLKSMDTVWVNMMIMNRRPTGVPRWRLDGVDAAIGQQEEDCPASHGCSCAVADVWKLV